MQCMMKKSVPVPSAAHRFRDRSQSANVYSCFNQDQLLDHVPFFLNERLKTELLQENSPHAGFDALLTDRSQAAENAAYPSRFFLASAQ